MTKEQIRMVRGMIAKAGLQDYKEELVLSFTDGATASLTAMNYDQTQDIVKYLKTTLNQPEYPSERSKRKILSLAHEMKWHMSGTRKVDMVRVNNWCFNKFDYGLDDLNTGDLNRAVTAFENVHLSYLKGI